MRYSVFTDYQEMILEIAVKSTVKGKIRLKVYDKEKPKTVFTNRFKTVQGTYKFFVRLPLTPKNVIIEIYNEANGNLPKNKDKSIILLDVKKKPLIKRADIVDINNYKVRSFVKLAQQFSFNASYLADNKNYVSSDKNYKISYLPVIKHSSGRTLKTPARSSKSTGRIEVSALQFRTYTVPMRMAILCHEFAHFFMNKRQDDETEADINGLLIYLSLGYPRIEAHEAFLNVFIGTPSPANKKRYSIIEQFIKDFDNGKVVLN